MYGLNDWSMAFGFYNMSLQLRRYNTLRFPHFYRAMLCRARYWYGKSSVRPWRWRYRDHIGRNTSKITSRFVSLGYSLSADPNTTDRLQKEHPQYFAGIGEGGCGKSGFRGALVALKRGKIGPSLLLRTNRKSHMCFRLVQKSTTFGDLEGLLCTLLQNTCAMVLLFIYL